MKDFQYKIQSITFCIFHKGFSGMRAAVFRSFSRPYADRESHANPYVTNNLPLWQISTEFREFTKPMLQKLILIGIDDKKKHK
jgi:hypothetical protein